MNNKHDISAPNSKYKLLNRYRFEIITVECPWCYNIISVVEDRKNRCSVCQRMINMEDITDDNA